MKDFDPFLKNLKPILRHPRALYMLISHHLQALFQLNPGPILQLVSRHIHTILASPQAHYSSISPSSGPIIQAFPGLFSLDFTTISWPRGIVTFLFLFFSLFACFFSLLFFFFLYITRTRKRFASQIVIPWPPASNSLVY